MASNKTLGFFAGTILGAAAGAVLGMMFAPRSGAESRAMAADAMNDAWDSAVDTYEQGSRAVGDAVDGFRPQVDVATDDLRAKVDAARERMNQMRDSLAETIAQTSEQVSDAVQTVTDMVNETVAGAAGSEPAGDVKVEPVEDASETE